MARRGDRDLLLRPVSTPNALRTAVDGESSVTIDDALWPIVIATWFGRPTEDLVDRYFDLHAQLLERAREEHTRLVLVTDTFATERPSPMARKRIVDRTEAQPSDVRHLTVESFIVIENPVIRGVVTALAWVYPKMSESKNVGSLAAALEGSIDALRNAGIATPKHLVPSAYRRPARPRAA